MISGAHVTFFSNDPKADSVFFRDVLQVPSVDIGGGWLVFGLPPAIFCTADAEKDSSGTYSTVSNGTAEFGFQVTDIEAFTEKLAENKVEFGKVEKKPWGITTTFVLPGGAKMMVYQPLHSFPEKYMEGAKPAAAAVAAKRAAEESEEAETTKTTAKRTKPNPKTAVEAKN